MTRRWIPLVLAVAALMSGGTAHGEDWPTRPITLVVPYAAGGPTGAIGRLFAQQIGEILKRLIVVENVGGAGGRAGANRVARAPPMGITFSSLGAP